MSMMSDNSDLSIDGIVLALRETVSSVFGEDMLLKLAVFEGLQEGEVELARLQIINWGSVGSVEGWIGASPPAGVQRMFSMWPVTLTEIQPPLWRNGVRLPHLFLPCPEK